MFILFIMYACPVDAIMAVTVSCPVGAPAQVKSPGKREKEIKGERCVYKLGKMEKMEKVMMNKKRVKNGKKWTKCGKNTV